jgi:hypothetical protein
VNRVLRIVAACALTSACGRVDFDPLAPHIYANTATDLYEIDPVTLLATHLVPLCANLPTPIVVGEIAYGDGLLVGLDEAGVWSYQIDLATGACTPMMLDTPIQMFGAEFVPAGVLDPQRAVLLGAANDNKLYRIDPLTGVTSVIGPLGANPSGDLAWTGDELLLTLDTGATPDVLARVDLATGAASAIGPTAYDGILGLAGTRDALYGFTKAGIVLQLDPTTGAATRMQPTGKTYYGATTR